MSPSALTEDTSRASICLKFIVVGGGIAGLATAYTLKKAGHRVVVLEKRDAKSLSFGMGGGGIRAPPNMTRLLYRWGLGPILRKKGRKFQKMAFMNGNHGDLLGYLYVGEDFFEALSTDMILIRHGDLVNILYDLAIQEGVEIRQNANVVHTDPKWINVKLDTGEIISGDIIVAADGHSGSLLSKVMGYPEKECNERVLIVTFTVETSLLRDDKGFKLLLDPTIWSEWEAEDMNISVLNMGEHLQGVLTRDYYGPSKEGDDEWNDERTLESYGLDFTALEPRVQKILKFSKTVASRIAGKRPVAEDFINDRSSVVFVGEAAHPMGMFECSQGTAMGIEDAETLGCLFSRIKRREQTKQFLMAYQEIRHDRCVRTYQLQVILDKTRKCPVGPEQESRDALVRETLTHGDWDHVDEAAFRAAWGDQLSIYAFDAKEGVDDWWRQWGSHISSSENHRNPSQL